MKDEEKKLKEEEEKNKQADDDKNKDEEYTGPDFVGAWMSGDKDELKGMVSKVSTDLVQKKLDEKPSEDE